MHSYTYTHSSSSTASLASSSDSDYLSQPSSSESSSSGDSFRRKRSRKRGKKPQLTPLKTDLTDHLPSSGSLSPSRILRLCCSGFPAPSHPSLPAPPTLARIPSQTPIPIPATPVSESPQGRMSRWDELGICVRALEGSGYPPAFDEAGWHLFRLLDSDILATRKAYRRCLQYTEEMAQLLVDALQWILQYHPGLEGAQKRKFLKALLRLSQRSQKLPRVYHISGIKLGDVAFQSSNVDVYKGTRQGRVVCLKKYRAAPFTPEKRVEITEMSIKETVLWFNYRHIGILPFQGVLQAGSSLEGAYLVSPFLEFGTITNFVALCPHVDRRLLIRDVLYAIVFLHENKVVHGDIKGCNVLVNASGRAVLADLGLSRLSDSDLMTWTSIQTIDPSAGTLPWLAPELLKAQHPMAPTTASDVYALGCLTYEVFTGQTPFSEITQGVSFAYRIFTEVVTLGKRPRRPSLGSEPYRQYGLTQEIWSMMDSCWSREVKLRPTASQLLQHPPFMTLVDDRPGDLEG